MTAAELRLGVDVGTVSTDAVLMDANDRLLVKCRLPPASNAEDAVRGAIGATVEAAGADPARVTRAMVGAASVMEALLKRRSLDRVAVIRIGAPLTRALPPLCRWPADLRRAVSAGEIVVGGGAEYDGHSAQPLDAEAVARFVASVAGELDVVAITGVFSPVAADQELAACEVVRGELGNRVPVSMSHEIGSLGLLGRENATVLNAALSGAAEALAATLKVTLELARIHADLYVAQSDGSVMAIEHALRYPVLMIGSRFPLAMRGAAYLSGVGDAVVVSVGSRSADVGVLVNGYPRESDAPPSIEGVRMDVRAPSTVTVAIGRDQAADQAELEAALPGAIVRAKGAHAALPLVAVGEGSARVPDVLPGVSEVMRPADGEMASAIGMAIAPVTGQADVYCLDRPAQRERALAMARTAAIESAIHAGADPRAVEVIEQSELPLSYLLDPAVQIRVKAAGPRI